MNEEYVDYKGAIGSDFCYFVNGELAQKPMDAILIHAIREKHIDPHKPIKVKMSYEKAIELREGSLSCSAPSEFGVFTYSMGIGEVQVVCFDEQSNIIYLSNE